MRRRCGSPTSFGTDNRFGVRSFNLKDVPIDGRRKLACELRMFYTGVLSDLFIGKAGLPDYWKDDLELILGEALTNAFCHNKPDLDDREFVTTVNFFHNIGPNIVIINSANLNNSEGIVRDSCMNLLVEGGRGIPLITHLVDETFHGNTQWRVAPGKVVMLLSMV